MSSLSFSHSYGAKKVHTTSLRYMRTVGRTIHAHTKRGHKKKHLPGGLDRDGPEPDESLANFL